jgi:hypothetical protein
MQAVIRLIDAGKTEIYETSAAVIRNITFLEEAEVPSIDADYHFDGLKFPIA